MRIFASVLALVACATSLTAAQDLSADGVQATGSGAYGGCIQCGISGQVARDFVSGELLSQQEFQYGRFEAKMRISAVSGTVSTFFLYKDGSADPGCTETQQLCRPVTLSNGQVITSRKQCWQELDAEGFGADKGHRMQSTIIVGTAEQRVVSNVRSNIAKDMSGEFALVALEWTPYYMRWFVDGVPVRTVDDCIYTQAMTSPMRLHLSLWGCIDEAKEWCGAFQADQLPTVALYDFVKVWTYDAANDAFVFAWQDDFTQIDDAKWWKADGTFNMNRATFTPDQVRTLQGNTMITLASKADQNTIPWSALTDVAPGSSGKEATGPTDPCTLGTCNPKPMGKPSSQTTPSTPPTGTATEAPAAEQYLKVLVANVPDVKCSKMEATDAATKAAYADLASEAAESLGLSSAAGNVLVITHQCDESDDSTLFVLIPSDKNFAASYGSQFEPLLKVWEATLLDDNSALNVRYPDLSQEYPYTWAIWNAATGAYELQARLTTKDTTTDPGTTGNTGGNTGDNSNQTGETKPTGTVTTSQTTKAVVKPTVPATQKASNGGTPDGATNNKVSSDDAPKTSVTTTGGDSGLSVGAIVGIAVGGAAGVALLATGVFLYAKSVAAAKAAAAAGAAVQPAVVQPVQQPPTVDVQPPTDGAAQAQDVTVQQQGGTPQNMRNRSPTHAVQEQC